MAAKLAQINAEVENDIRLKAEILKHELNSTKELGEKSVPIISSNIDVNYPIFIVIKHYFRFI